MKLNDKALQALKDKLREDGYMKAAITSGMAINTLQNIRRGKEISANTIERVAKYLKKKVSSVV